MNALFDTHEMVKDLVAVGFTDGQAEVVTRSLQRAQVVEPEPLATKADLTNGLAQAKADLMHGLAHTDAKLMQALAETNTDTLKWMTGTIGAQTVIILGTLLALARTLPRP